MEKSRKKKYNGYCRHSKLPYAIYCFIHKYKYATWKSQEKKKIYNRYCRHNELPKLSFRSPILHFPFFPTRLLPHSPVPHSPVTTFPLFNYLSQVIRYFSMCIIIEVNYNGYYIYHRLSHVIYFVLFCI